MLRRLLAAALLIVPAAAFAQEGPGATAPQPATAQAPVHSEAAPTGPTESPDIKHDAGTIHTVDAQRGIVICDMPDGPVTYDVSQAQLLDAEGKPAGVAATGLKTGDKVRITYKIDNGAHASEVRILK